MQQVLLGNVGFVTLAALLFLEILATSFTLGGGGSGGIFAPSLFMGAMLGRFFGRIAYRFLPGIVAPSGAYALVGMAAVFAGAAQAPITSFFILFEMTGSPQMSVIELIKKLNKMGHHGLPVVDEVTFVEWLH